MELVILLISKLLWFRLHFPIRNFEKILKFFGSTDPLRDDSIRILYPISKVEGLDVRGYEFYNYWHAFNGIGQKDLRKMPELRFYVDESIEYGNNIERILDDIKKDDE